MLSLLAPAGSPAALAAALCGGADEVYLGLESFNARRNADNFRLDTLQEACDAAHLRGVAVNLALNTLVFDDELDECAALARDAWRLGVDALIVADVGLIARLRTALPEARLHFSTQLSISDKDDLEAAAALGASRVTLARELSLEEITRLVARANELDLEVETFAHGALCVCYSGQCLLSSMIGGRSANRGRCAQACRLPYELIDGATGRALPTPGEHLLSPKDLCLIDELSALTAAGVHSIKIEGRMKSADYVAAVTATYRTAIDRLAAGEQPDASARSTLDEAFSRGFTTGLFDGVRSGEMMSYDRPNNRGVAMGRVARVGDGVVSIRHTRPLAAGDLLEVWTRRGRVAVPVNATTEDARGVCALPLPPDGRSVRSGDRVFRVRSAALSFQERPHEPRVALDGVARYRHDEPLTIAFRPTAAAELAGVEQAIARRLAARFDAGEPRGAAEGPLAEPARTKALTVEDFEAHVDRLGETPYRLAALEVSLDDGLGLGFSTIHHTRDDALAALTAAVLAPWHERTLAPPSAPASPPAAGRPAPRVVVFASDGETADAAVKAGANAIYVPAERLVSGEQARAGVVVDDPSAAFPSDSVAVLSAVMHDACGAAAERRRDLDPHRLYDDAHTLVANSIGAVCQAMRAGASFEIGAGLPLLNGAGLAAAAVAGASLVWLSPELPLRAIERIGRSAPVPLGIVVSGAERLMTTEHCLLMSQGPCDERCDRCPRRRGPHRLRDRKGFEFPIVTDPLGRSALYNGVPLDIVPWIFELLEAGVTTFAVDATLLDPEATRRAVKRVQAALDDASEGAHLPKLSGTTTGHLFRGPS